MELVANLEQKGGLGSCVPIRHKTNGRLSEITCQVPTQRTMPMLAFRREKHFKNSLVLEKDREKSCSKNIIDRLLGMVSFMNCQ